jgi:hypothetical protein
MAPLKRRAVEGGKDNSVAARLGKTLKNLRETI